MYLLAPTHQPSVHPCEAPLSNDKLIIEQVLPDLGVSPSPPNKILFVGSSLIKHVDHVRMSRKGKTCSIISLSGAHIVRINDYLKSLPQDSCNQYSELLVLGGGNNVQNQGAVRRTLAEFDDLAETINSKFRHCRVFIYNIIPRYPAVLHQWDSRPKFMDRFHAVNHHIRYLCGANGFSFISCISHLTDETGGLVWDKNERKGMFTKDGIHLTLKGTAVIAKVGISVIYDPW